MMKRLGHKRVENTVLYTQPVLFESEEYHSAVVVTIDEAWKLIENGFEYFFNHENVSGNASSSRQLKCIWKSGKAVGKVYFL